MPGLLDVAGSLIGTAAGGPLGGAAGSAIGSILGGVLGMGASDAAAKAAQTALTTGAANANGALSAGNSTAQGYALPYASTGSSAEQRLAQIYGLADGGLVTAGGIVGGVNGGSSPGNTRTYNGVTYNASDTPEWATYLQDNPDVAQAYNTSTNAGFKAAFPTATDFAAYHYATSGQGEGRQVTPTATAAASGSPAASSGSLDPNTTFYQSPDYAFTQARGLGGVQASAAANGMADSGAARKAEIEFSSGLAAQQYNTYADRLAQIASGGLQAGQFGAAAATGTGTAQAGVDTSTATNLANSLTKQGQTDGSTLASIIGAAGKFASSYGSSANQNDPVNQLLYPSGGSSFASYMGKF